MKVNIGPYRYWIGPFQIAEKILFWKDKDDDTVYKFGQWLSNIEWLYQLCLWIDKRKTRKIKVKLDHYDTWSLDDTLAHIILPALKQFKLDQTGHPCGILPDPNGETETGNPCGNCGCEKEWNIILDKMIYSFEHIVDDRILVYTTEEYKESQKKIQEGLELFGKYFQTLWT
jgi:hypothetical protein